jgi:hypothetical protein
MCSAIFCAEKGRPGAATGIEIFPMGWKFPVDYKDSTVTDLCSGLPEKAVLEMVLDKPLDVPLRQD